jgi:hypothetical protein
MSGVPQGSGQDLSAKHGYHFQMQMQNPNGKDCVRCHLQHNGENFKLIHREPSEEKFDHRLTGYKLEGNSIPVEILVDSVIMDVNGAKQTIAVWIFACGEPPSTFLKKVGVGFGERDVTPDGARAIKEAKEASLTPA